MKYITCDKCGANLDHNEKCDCEGKELIKKILDGYISFAKERKENSTNGTDLKGIQA